MVDRSDDASPHDRADQAVEDDDRPPWVGLSLMVSDDFRSAALPLFERGIVDIVEWNVDGGWGRSLPEWAPPLLAFYAEQERLVGHGVELSLFSVEWTARQQTWMEHLKEECRARSYRHLSEHFGFMTADGFAGGTPLPLPKSRAAVELGVRRLRMLGEAAGVPVGLENLAMAFSQADVLAQADMVSEILERANGFLLLDLHNVLCQAQNFDLDPVELMRRYPLERARQIHIAGGRIVWPSSDPSARPFRRDSHDEAIPKGAMHLLDEALGRTPHLECVVVERSDYSIYGADAEAQFTADYEAVRSHVASFRHAQRNAVSA